MKSWVAHLLVPHTSNNHKPKALHVDALFVYLLLLLAYYVGIQALHRTFPNVLGFATDIHVEQLLASTNEKRRQAGLPELSLNAQLSQAAANKAVDMFANGYWSHTSPNGKTPWEFIVSTGYRYSVAGENLAKNFLTSLSVVDAWMASATHRENILKPGYEDVGFAVVNGILNGEETTLVVQMFGANAAARIVQPVRAVEIPQEARQTAAADTLPVNQPLVVPALSGAGAFAGVTTKPLFSIPALSRELGYTFLGLLIVVLTADAWLVARRRLVRLSGQSVAHGLFLVAVAVAVTLIERGSLI